MYGAAMALAEATPTPSVQENVSSVVRVLLAAHGQRQQGLRSVLDEDETGVSKLMNNRKRWTIEHLGALAAHFDEPVAVFYESPRDLLRSR
jgi:antitoxin component HigA of HigAB toxin-antitoxin module